jgi:tetratricopeptide (TPR) repeat protein
MTIKNAVQHDARGVPLSSCHAGSLEDYEKALYQFHSYFGDPTETLTTTLENDPEFVMGHIFNASAMLMMSERQYLPMVRESIEAAEALAGKSTEREKMMTQAARQWMEGFWDKASVTWDRVLVEHPRDALSLQCAHLTDFLLGDATNLRDRVGRILGHWDRDVPSYSYILGMQAFGLEEMNEFERAEDTGRRAVELNPRDPWAIHAVAHVLEMTGRLDNGVDWMTERTDDWASDNMFAFHNWWHLALYYMEQEDFDNVLRLYDEQILPAESNVSMQMLDASSLLWRLHLQGIDVGNRWELISELWSRKTALENGYYAFNDMHAVIAFLGAGRLAEAREVLDDQKKASESNPGISRMMAADVGVPVCTALIAFAEQRYADAVDSLYPVRTIANRFGGSNAQRDILTQTLIESAIRSGNAGLATNLMNERSVHKPFSPLTARFKSKIIQ